MAQLPAGMRNNNPGNIKYIGQAGTRPSVNTDQGDPQAVFASPEAGMAAMFGLLNRKYTGGKTTPNAIIAGQGGWTPGNFEAAANVARTAGISPDADIMFSDPAAAARFMRGLLRQEHGPASDAYTDAMIAAAIGSGAAPTSGLAAMMAPGDAAGVQGFAPPAFGDVVAADDPMSSIGLGFIKRAEEKRAAEDDRARERRRALFAQPVAPPTGGLGGLYG